MSQLTEKPASAAPIWYHYTRTALQGALPDWLSVSSDESFHELTNTILYQWHDWNDARYSKYAVMVNWHRPFVHPLYWQVLSLPLQLELMESPSFPFKVLGLVHLSNQFEGGAIALPKRAERLKLSARFGECRAHKRGVEFDILIHVEYVNRTGEPVIFSATSTYLARQPDMIDRVVTDLAANKTSKSRAHKKIHDVVTCDTFHLTPAASRKYALLSGDYNPIHISPLTSQLFGYKQPIAHGMHTKALVLSSLLKSASRAALSSKLSVTCSFKSPMFLPATGRLVVDAAASTQAINQDYANFTQFELRHTSEASSKERALLAGCLYL